MVKVYSNGMMEKFIKDNLKEDNLTAMELFTIPMGNKLRESGTEEKISNSRKLLLAHLLQNEA